MSLNESIVEDAALEWFGELGYAVGHGPHLAPGEYAEGTLTPALSQREKEEEREAIRRLNPAIPSRTTLRDPDRSGLPKLLSGELSGAEAELLK